MEGQGPTGAQRGPHDYEARVADRRDEPIRLKDAEEFDPRPGREKIRARLAQALAAALIVVVLSLIFLTAFDKLTVGDAKDLSLAILSPLTAIAGTALGFYFGGRDGD
ncbi:MAG: hypothetical protein ACJ766_02890 [Thermoleophilaceae bacterium]